MHYMNIIEKKEGKSSTNLINEVFLILIHYKHQWYHPTHIQIFIKYFLKLLDQKETIPSWIILEEKLILVI